MKVEAEAWRDREMPGACRVGTKVPPAAAASFGKGKQKRAKEAEVARGAFDQDGRSVKAANAQAALLAAEPGANGVVGVGNCGSGGSRLARHEDPVGMIGAGREPPNVWHQRRA